MDKEYEEKYHQLEASYWWFYSRRDIILDLLVKQGVSKDAKILEIGCSGGPLLQQLQEAGYRNAYGIDISENAIAVCHSKGIENAKEMDALHLDFENASFDVIIASDILEHVEADSQALNEWNRVLKRNGVLIAFVPAFQSIWSKHDEINHHYRRYTKGQLVELLVRNNFSILKASYWNFLLFFPTFIIRKLQRLNKNSSVKTDNLYQINPIVNALLKALLKIEKKALKVINFPLGVSVMTVSRKV